jgi:hypothetical protein
LSPKPTDRIIEFAPGLGVTAQWLIDVSPKRYTGIERDESAAKRLGAQFSSPSVKIINTSAEDTGLEDGATDLVVGEALLTMQPLEVKRKIVTESFRLLSPGGRYGIHEIALMPEDISEESRKQIHSDMSSVIHHGVSPLSVAEWRELLTEVGYTNINTFFVGFKLLEPTRMIADEGLFRAVRIALNMVRMPDARRRVLAMRRTFRKYRNNLSAIVITAQKE